MSKRQKNGPQQRCGPPRTITARANRNEHPHASHSFVCIVRRMTSLVGERRERDRAAPVRIPVYPYGDSGIKGSTRTSGYP